MIFVCLIIVVAAAAAQWANICALQGFVVVITIINHNQRHTVAIRVIAALRAAFSVIMEGSNH